MRVGDILAKVFLCGKCSKPLVYSRYQNSMFGTSWCDNKDCEECKIRFTVEDASGVITGIGSML